MTHNDDPRDPLRAAFQDYGRAPRDVVPPTPHRLDDLRALADGGPVTVTHYEMTPEGITRHVETVGVAKPFTERTQP
jgi:hypothetical protein